MAGLLANGAGGLDWSGLSLVCAWHGITDVEGLMDRLAVIRLHRPAGGNNAPQTE